MTIARISLLVAFVLASLGCASRAGLVPKGAVAPDFEATAQTGERVQLSKLAGKWVVLYFYPRDETPGCTKEACSFRDSWKKLAAEGVVVVGVSTDDVEAHRQFAEKHQLPFLLVPDPDGAICRRYGVPVTLGYAARVTYLVGKDGRVRRVWPTVEPMGHADELLAEIAAARGEGAK